MCPLCLCLTFQQKSALRLARVQGCPLLFFFGFAGYVCFGFCVNGFAYRLFLLFLSLDWFGWSGLLFSALLFGFSLWLWFLRWFIVSGLCLFFVVRLVWLEWFVVFGLPVFVVLILLFFVLNGFKSVLF
jgi:hypothetical protein